MKLRKDDPLNLRAYRVVKNFNEKQRRVEASGRGYAPKRVSVKELKNRYSKRSDLTRVLNQLENFNRMGRKAYEVVENQGGGRTNRWRYEFTKANLVRARKYWQKRLAYQMDLYTSDTHYPVRKENVENTKRIVKLLATPAQFMTTSQLKSAQVYIMKMEQEQNLRASDYRFFMSRISEVMENLGYSEKEINGFFEKFTQMNPDDFWKMYQESDILRDTYENIIPSDPHGDLPVSEKDARDKIGVLFDYVDKYIKKYKKS